MTDGDGDDRGWRESSKVPERVLILVSISRAQDAGDCLGTEYLCRYSTSMFVGGVRWRANFALSVVNEVRLSEIR